jgi:DNA-binding CsgD family transcriptional regulator
VVAGPASEFVAVRADGSEFAARLRFARINEDPAHLANWIQDLTEDRTVVTQKPRRKICPNAQRSWLGSEVGNGVLRLAGCVGRTTYSGSTDCDRGRSRRRPVLTFASRRQAALTDQFVRSLRGIGYETGHFLARRRGELSAPALSPRELQVLQLSATGYARRQIAEEIDLSEATVKTHMEHIYKKLGVPDRASAVARALRQGLIH